MSAVKSNLTINSYAQRSQTVGEIKNLCIRAERGEKVNLNETVEKLKGLVQQLNEDATAINNGTRISLDVRKAYDLHRNDLTVLNARVNALSTKANNIPAWVKPTVYAVLAIAGIAAMGVGFHLIRGTTPPGPTPPGPIAEITSDEAVEVMTKLLLDEKRVTDNNLDYDGYFKIKNIPISLNGIDGPKLMFFAVDKLLKEKRIVGWSWARFGVSIKQYENDPIDVKVYSHSPFSEKGLSSIPALFEKEFQNLQESLQSTIREINKQVKAAREKQNQTSASQATGSDSQPTVSQ